MRQEKTTMNSNWGINVYIFPLIILNVAILVRGQCDGVLQNLERTDGMIESPNFGDELGKKSTCSWKINLPTNQFAVLQIEDLRLHFTSSEGRLHCMQSYVLKINGEKTGCDPPRLTESKSPPTTFCMQFQSPLCRSTQLCPAIASTDDPLEITYHSDGATPPPMSSPHLTGFRIRYTLYSCQQTDTTSSALVSSMDNTQPPYRPSPSSVYKPNVDHDISTVTYTMATLTKDSKAETSPATHRATLAGADATECSEQPESWTATDQSASLTVARQSTSQPVADKPAWRAPEQLTTRTVAIALGAALGLVLLCVAVCVIRKNLFPTVVLEINGRRRANGAANNMVVKYTATGGEDVEGNDVEVGAEPRRGVIENHNGHGATNQAFEIGGEDSEPIRRLAHVSGDLISQQRSLSNGTPQSIEVNRSGTNGADRITKAMVTQDEASASPATSHFVDEIPPSYSNCAFQGIDSASPTPSVTYSNAETAPYNEDRASLLSLNVQPFSRGVSTRRHSEGESPTPPVTYSNAETVPDEGDPGSLSSTSGVNEDHEPARNCRRRRSNSVGRRHSETEVKRPT